MRLIDADALIQKYPTHQSMCDKVSKMPTVESATMKQLEEAFNKGYEEGYRNAKAFYKKET